MKYEGKYQELRAVLMIRVKICPDITLSSKNTLTFPLIMYSKCVIKFILTGQAPKLTGKCLVTGCYYKHCTGTIVFAKNHLLECNGRIKP